MDDIRNKAHEAHFAASILALGIQKMKMLDRKVVDRVYDSALNSLRRCGVDIEIPEIKNIGKLPVPKALEVVVQAQSRIIAVLQGVCGPRVSRLFELTFGIYFASTAPEIIPDLREDFIQRATQLGFKESEFKETLDLMETDVFAGLAKYEDLVKEYLERVDKGLYCSPLTGRAN